MHHYQTWTAINVSPGGDFIQIALLRIVPLREEEDIRLRKSTIPPLFNYCFANHQAHALKFNDRDRESNTDLSVKSD